MIKNLDITTHELNNSTVERRDINAAPSCYTDRLECLHRIGSNSTKRWGDRLASVSVH